MKDLIRKFLKYSVVMLYRGMALFLPIRTNVIMFNSSMGKNYTGNPRYIYEAFVKAGLDKKYRAVWAFHKAYLPFVQLKRNSDETKYDRANFNGVCMAQLPGETKIVTYGYLRYYYYMAVAKIWVFDCRQEDYLIKRKGCHYIQTWHGTPLKKLALDMEELYMSGEGSLNDYKNKFRSNTKSWDYLISQNPFSTETFRRCFHFDKTMLEIGYPRNDILLNQNNEQNQIRLKKKLGLPLDKKIILYAPTWRDDKFYGGGWYEFTTELDFQQLREVLGKEVFLMVKYHYLVKSNLDLSKEAEFLRVFDNSYDISELYLAADALITDYSSVMFDYSLLNRPMFFYTYDLEEYRDNLRGFYFDFSMEAPGPLVQSTKELIEAIQKYQTENFQERYHAFRDKYTSFDQGDASRNIIKLIEELFTSKKLP